jgi:RimJ/RimL family protein N-acetyltransferase
MTHTPHTMPTTLMTPRLRLRAPVLADASRIAMFIGAWDVAKMLATVPHPYTEADAKRWIADPGHEPVRFVVVHANGVIGAIGAGSRDKSGALELGYWLAQPFWGRGFMTEAVSAVIKALRSCDECVTVTCSHFADNPASSAVIRKLGFVPTGDRQTMSVARGETVRALTYRLPYGAETASRETELETAGGVI